MSRESSRAAFERKMSRHDHADVSVIFAEREEAEKKGPASAEKRPQNLTNPPGAAKIAGAPAAEMSRSRTEPKLVIRR